MAVIWKKLAYDADMGLRKIADVSLSGDASKTISSALEAGKKYKLVFTLLQNTSNGYFAGIFNNDTDANYYFAQIGYSFGSSADGGGNALTTFIMTYYKSPTISLIAAGSYFTVEMLIHAGPIGSHQAKAHWTINYIAAVPTGLSGVVSYGGAADLNRFDIGTSAGTLTGTVTLYEML